MAYAGCRQAYILRLVRRPAEKHPREVPWPLRRKPPVASCNYICMACVGQHMELLPLYEDQIQVRSCKMLHFSASENASGLANASGNWICHNFMVVP